MPRGKPAIATIDAISDQRAKLQAQLSDLDRKEKALRETERDAGRKVFFSALEKVKIGEMSRSEAKAIADAISMVPASQLLTLIGDTSGRRPKPTAAD